MNPSWTGRDALLAATGHHFLARFSRGGDDIVGYEDSGTVVWTTGSFADSLGDPLVAAAIGTRLSGLTFLDLPRLNGDDAARLFPAARRDDWEIRWTTEAPPHRSLEDAVVPLGPQHHDTIDDLLNEALPYTNNRPGDSRIRHWYGIFDGDRLVAVGAERSRHDVGYLAAIAVSPEPPAPWLRRGGDGDRDPPPPAGVRHLRAGGGGPQCPGEGGLPSSGLPRSATSDRHPVRPLNPPWRCDHRPMGSRMA